MAATSGKSIPFVWNFAIGSNINMKTLKRRGIEPLEVVNAVVYDYRLAFDVNGIPWVEPAFASIRPEKGEAVHGVLLKLTPEMFEQLVRTEGGDRSYSLEKVTAIPYAEYKGKRNCKE